MLYWKVAKKNPKNKKTNDFLTKSCATPQKKMFDCNKTQN